MKFYRLNPEEMEQGLVCCYEFWDKKQKKLVNCGEPAVWSEGANCKNPLCSEHGRFCGAINQNRDYPSMRDELFAPPQTG